MPPRTTRPTSLPELLAALVLLVTGAAALTACGDDASGTGTTAAATDATAPPGAVTDTGASGKAEDATGDELEPVAAPDDIATEFLVSGNAEEVCGDLISPQLLSSTYGDLDGCRNGRPPESLAKSVEFNDLAVTGKTATAVAVPKGGSYDGAPVAFTFELDDDGWVITKVEADIPVGP